MGRHKKPRPKATWLSPRQIEVLLLLCDGHTNESIGNQLDITQDTVRDHLTRAMKRWECHTRIELAVKYVTRKYEALLKEREP